jgi:hypothetical protein
VAFPETVAPSTWKSPLDRITPMDGGAAIRKSKQPLVMSERKDRIGVFIFVASQKSRLSSCYTYAGRKAI